MNIVTANQNNFSAAINLLKQILGRTTLFVAEEQNSVIATIAAEHDGHIALLRSLSVLEAKKSRGIGKSMIGFIESYLQRHSIRTVYLLTTTAKNFFLKNGYEITSRDDVPNFIQETTEYSVVCPASAVLMKKTIV